MKNLLFKILMAILSITLICICFLPKNKSSDNEVVFWTLQMNDFSEYMNNVIDDFERENPDIKIKWIDIPFSEGEKRTLAAVLSDNPPDLINLNPDFSALLAERKALFEIEDNYTTQYNKAIIHSLKYDDKLYSLPWYATSAITIYNKDIILKSNVKMPKTYDDVFEIAPKIKSQTGKYVMLPNITENDTMVKILNKYGVTTENINSKTSQKVFELFKKMYDYGYIPKETITQTHREALEKYMAGQIVFFQAGANFLNLIKENAKLIYESTDVTEQIKGSKGQNDISLMNLVIPLKSRNKENALKFALFLTNNENQLKLAKLANIIAVNEQTLQDEFYTTTKSNDKLEKARIISAKQLNQIEPVLKTTRNQKEINNLINTAVQEILSDKDTVENTINRLENKLLNQK